MEEPEVNFRDLTVPLALLSTPFDFNKVGVVLKRALWTESFTSSVLHHFSHWVVASDSGLSTHI